MIIACILVVLVPFNLAIVQLALRKMKAVNEITLATYIVIPLLLLSAGYVLFFVPKMISFESFTSLDWFLILLQGIFGSSL
jgi:drug/metabolite transporter (DMT)-like permease